MNFEEKTVKLNYIYQGKILNLRRDDVSLPNGNLAVREIVEHSGGSCIYCEKDGKILFVKQFRYAYNKELLELPAGKHNPNETPKETAIRELEEETGLKASDVTLMFEVYQSPGYTNEVIKIFKAEGLTQSVMHLDEDEFLSGVWIEKDKVKKMIQNGEICDAKTLIALLKML